MLPFLIFLVTRFGGNAVIYGVMGATYSAFQLIGAPILGKWSDAYGRRKILLLSQIGTLTSWLIFIIAMLLPVYSMLEINSKTFGAFTLTLPLIVLFFARALDGITGGNVSVANAYLADISDEDNRSANFGKMAVAANLGFIFGPALAGLLGGTSWGELVPVSAALLISVIATAIITLLLPESQPCVIERDPEVAINVRKVLGQEQKECYRLAAAENITFREILRLKHVAFLLTIYFLDFLGFNLFYIAFPVHVVQELNWELSDTGPFYAFIGLMMALVQGPILSRIAKRWADRNLIVTGSFILACSFLFFLSPQTWTLYLGAALLAFGNGIMWPSYLSNSLASNR